ncbi:hypothetical protein [Ruminococcus bovis]|uniref:Uncharacterized protein n=1 Tax=Ruminococcus bovis TaxID=2564099 RepID=A0A4P8XWC8_9FIRM|nr:hypothetical protein [Ruminococcus bovis]QCT06754.1 hypothetical protein E5Z56_04990 [Ruminococcus bovis]
MKNTTKRFTTLAATALIAVSTLGAAAVTASAKSVDVQPSTTQYGVVQQVKNARAFKYNAYGITSYGYDYTYKATNNNIDVKVNYDFKTNKYEFNVLGKKAGNVQVTLIWNVNDKRTNSATFNLKVDNKGNVNALGKVTPSNTNNTSVINNTNTNVNNKQFNNAKAFKYYAKGKTTYGYNYDYKVTNNIVDVKVNYDFKANKYEFNVLGKKSGNTQLTLIWNVNNKKTNSATFNLRVDNKGNVTALGNVVR